MKSYIKELSKVFGSRKATEHSYRPALIKAIEKLAKDYHATNEPKRRECGAPDIIVESKDIAIGFIETKDLDKSIAKEKNTGQLKRYRSSLTNLILTNYLDFTWFVYGKEVRTISIGKIEKGKINFDEEMILELESLLKSFLKQKHPSIKHSNELAFKMAQSAQMIKKAIHKALSSEDAGGTLRHQFEGFKEVLLPSLDDKSFSDMYAQTICYGLFAARVNSKSKDFTRKNAAYDLPKTNPFLRKMFTYIAGPDLDSRVTWILDDFTELLSCADIDSIINEFTSKAKHKDPIIHFYEDFLEEYDPKLKKVRGVYYTPEPVVDFITSSVNEILEDDFKIKDGLANRSQIEVNGKKTHKVLLLDPAAGTGTFLQKIIEKIHERFSGQKGMWSSYVREHLLPRIFGFEILMAPYTIAHMKLGFKLAETGYDFKSEERLKVFLTNTLEEIVKTESVLPFTKWLTEEANAANYVKKDLPILVVFGNPPYSGISSNKGKWIIDLLKGKLPNGEKTHSYYEIEGKPLGEKKTWLQDDYVKFIRWAQHRLDQTGSGVLAFITNHGFIDNKTFRGMREKILKSFSEIYILDCHGNSNKGETGLKGEKDENVFDIQQGVSVNIFIKREEGDNSLGQVYHHEIYGSREDKYDWLGKNNIKTAPWKKVKNEGPFYYFRKVKKTNASFYANWPKLDEVMTRNISGIVTARDGLVIDTNEDALVERIYDFLDESHSDSEVKKLYNLKENYSWRVGQARIALRNTVGDRYLNDFVKPILYRPFDRRRIFFDESVVWRTRGDIMSQLIDKENLGLIASGQTKNKWNVFVTNTVAGHKTCSAYDINNIFPLYIYPVGQLELDAIHSFEPGVNGRRPNFTQKFVSTFSKNLGLAFISDGRGDQKKTFGPEDLFYYIYAIFYSNSYSKLFGENLKRNYPRIPFCSDKKAFNELVSYGEVLVQIHNQTASLKKTNFAKFPVSGDNIVEFVKYNKDEERVYINKQQYFENVPVDTWSFCFGGYQVCDKWLKDRKGQELGYDDLSYYSYIVRGTNETLSVSNKIDEVISKAGGWKSFILKKEEEQGKVLDFKKLPEMQKKRVALGSMIIDSLQKDTNLGRVKFAKAFYLADQKLEDDLDTTYFREVAGPLDYSLFYDEKSGVEKLCIDLGILSVENGSGKYHYSSAENTNKIVEYSEEMFGEKYNELLKLLKILKPMKSYQAEIVATLYACWNDCIIKNKKRPSKKQIIQEFLKNWNKSKERFSEERISTALDWMKEKNLVPSGNGRPTRLKKR